MVSTSTTTSANDNNNLGLFKNRGRPYFGQSASRILLKIDVNKTQTDTLMKPPGSHFFRRHHEKHGIVDWIQGFKDSKGIFGTSPYYKKHRIKIYYKILLHIRINS